MNSKPLSVYTTLTCVQRWARHCFKVPAVSALGILLKVPAVSVLENQNYRATFVGTFQKKLQKERNFGKNLIYL